MKNFIIDGNYQNKTLDRETGWQKQHYKMCGLGVRRAGLISANVTHFIKELQ